MIDLDKLEALAREATPGEWERRGSGYVWATDGNNDDNDPVARAGTGDAAFIAAANPETVLALVARVRDLEGLLFDSARDLDTAMDQGDYSNVRDRLFAALRPTEEKTDGTK